VVAAVLGAALAAVATAAGQQPAPNPPVFRPAGDNALAFQQPPNRDQQPAVLGQPRVAPVGEAAPPPGAGGPAAGRFDVFGVGHPRLRSLPEGVRAPVGTTPLPNKEAYRKFATYIGVPIDPEITFDIVIGRPRLVPLKETPFRIQVANPGVLDYVLINDREMMIVGLNVGTTIMNFWFGDPGDLQRQIVLSMLVNVLPDPEAKERLERVYKALEDEINRAFPDSYVCLFLVADKLVVTGEAKDTTEAQRILQILSASAPFSPNATLPLNQVNLNLNAVGPDALPPQALENFLLTGQSNIVNLLRVPGEQQVMLKVVLAEINRNAARSVGINFEINGRRGVVFAPATGLEGGGNVTIGPIGPLPNTVQFFVNFLRTVNLARSLAEPNLVTLNGQPANFFVGGQFPIPVVAGGTFTGLQGVSFVPFGVQLSFTPFITDHDRIRLQVQATVSALSAGNSATIAGTNVPGLTDRTINTQVEMREGQTFAIGGLIQSSLTGSTSRIPLFGDIPFGGQFFRSDADSLGEQELVLLVTPELVHPMEPKEIPALPSSDYFEPGDLEFFLYGRLESYRQYDYRSSVMDDIHRMAAYRHCELLYFVGPSGHSDGRP
jgi:pilus assembly protein CpaC